MWKEIGHCNGNYLINEKGEVYSKKTNKLLKGSQTKGYKFIYILYKGKYRSPKIHRLVAETFIENIYNKPIINHKDGNPLNNNVNNLEWVTYSENTKHAYKIGLQKPLKGKENPMYGMCGKNNIRSKRIFMFSLSNLFIREFESAELSVKWLRNNGFPKANSSSISQCCNKKRYKTAYKHIWRYANEIS